MRNKHKTTVLTYQLLLIRNLVLMFPNRSLLLVTIRLLVCTAVISHNHSRIWVIRMIQISGHSLMRTYLRMLRKQKRHLKNKIILITTMGLMSMVISKLVMFRMGFIMLDQWLHSNMAEAHLFIPMEVITPLDLVVHLLLHLFIG